MSARTAGGGARRVRRGGLVPALLALTLALATGCTSSRPPRMVLALATQATRAAQNHAALDETLAAGRLERLLAAFDGPGLQAALDAGGLGGHVRAAPLPSTLWGVNRAPRAPREAGLGRRVLCYLPDRLLDVLDLFSVDLRVGWGLLADVHVTRSGSLGAGLAGTLGVGWHEQRSLGARVGSSAGWRVGPLGGGFDLGFDTGTGERQSGGGRREDGSGPLTLIHQEWRDHWALGAEAQLVLVGAAVDVHPLEFIDLIAGFFGFDPGNDDRASTRAQPLLERAAHDAQALRECLADPATMAAWCAAADG